MPPAANVLKEIDLGPVWSGPAVSRGRVYVGTGNILFSSPGNMSLFPHQPNGAVVSFGLPGEDEVSRMKDGRNSSVRAGSVSDGLFRRSSEPEA